MRGTPKLAIVAALLALLLVLGFAACGGGGGDSSSTASEAPPTRAEAKPQGEAPAKGKPKSGAEGKPADRSGGGEGTLESTSSPSTTATRAVARKQFRVKGGDNSIQEFGAEADRLRIRRSRRRPAQLPRRPRRRRLGGGLHLHVEEHHRIVQKLAAQAKQVKDTSCAGILGKLTNPAAKQAMKAEAAQADVGSLRIEGERAFVIYTGTDGTVLAMPMASEGGSWKVASLAGTPLS